MISFRTRMSQPPYANAAILTVKIVRPFAITDGETTVVWRDLCATHRPPVRIAQVAGRSGST